MNTTLQSRSATSDLPALSALSASRLARAYSWMKRTRANARARRSLAQVDARTLRDIGFTRRELAVFTVITTGAR